MTALLIAALAVSFALGYVLVGLLWPRDARNGHDLLARICFSAGCGVGLSSFTYLSGPALLGSTGRGFILIEVGLTVALGAVLFAWRGAGGAFQGEPSGAGARPSLRLRPVALAVLSISALCTVVVLVLYWVSKPHGDWDAFAMWNLRAKFLDGPGESWKRAFTDISVAFHPDYPLLMPAGVARVWRYAGSQTLLAPIAIGALFLLASLGLVVAGLMKLRSGSEAAMAMIVLLGTPYYVKHTGYQMADVPFAFYLLATLVPLCLYIRTPHRGYLLLAGLMASFAAWTKNEGLLLIVAVSLAWVVRMWGLPRGRRDPKALITIGLGALPGLAGLIYFKLRVAPPNDLVASLSFPEAVLRLTDGGRYLEILLAFWRQVTYVAVGEWGYYILAFPVYLGVVRYTSGIKIDVEAAKVPALVIGLMFLGYMGVYCLSPYDLRWHLDTSLGRLLLHLWPATVFTLLLAVKIPEGLIVRRSN